MGNFWADRLGQTSAPAPAPVAPSAPQPPAGVPGPWWQPRASQPVPQQQSPQRATGGYGAVAEQPPEDQQNIAVLLSQPDYTTTKAQSAKDTELCPECASPNFMRAPGHPNSLKQCYDCGYNERFLHSTHGVSLKGIDLPQRTARAQIRSENNFNPQGIVAYV